MIVMLAARVAQLVFAAVVLALSVVLIKGYGPGSAPALISYGAFCGGAAIVVAAVNVLALFLDKLQGIIMLALDGLASFFLVAGGIAFAVSIKTGDCKDQVYTFKHKSTFYPSFTKTYPTTSEKKAARMARDDIVSRCRMVTAETAILWFTFACFLATVVLAFLTGRSGKRGGAIV
ncbi:hypothetical protein ONS95_013274 [Cadophora gregata]|uniref:uncharacterized protein n=1 Tax=Cadophora gregata TaxID=51156 RepID=UPI0026DD02D9|nr:uncharacterized protein ONS95_013274 [Cadophora gregata]KAK0099901.1 hypothetical protein ONS96_007850 [Cadophora gregata f. sp. sojae]KAK0116249.1 hypothetical protein ONS95_013274 [Cadophora gregata]